ncbi:MAG: HD-GYP domain-containing protein [Chloroflexota bacterium]
MTISCEELYGPLVDFAVNVLALRDEATAGHSHRVANLCVSLGQKMGLGDEDLVTLRIGGLLHDIGKLGVPDDILMKPNPLDGMEWQIMRQHPTIGAALLKDFPCFETIMDIVEMHHERWDGSGYPQGLSGENVPLLARICAVAEAFDGLLSEQVYKPIWSTMDVLEAMELRSGKSFDPEIIAALRQLANEI